MGKARRPAELTWWAMQARPGLASQAESPLALAPTRADVYRSRYGMLGEQDVSEIDRLP